MVGSNEALETFDSVLPWLSGRTEKFQSNPQFSNWSEKLLAKAALLAGDEVSNSVPYSDGRLVETALRTFRLWSGHPTVKQWISSSATQTDGTAEYASNSKLWRSYYNLLTVVLQHDLPYVSATHGSGRSQLANELRRVESICEKNLLREVKFPTANAGTPQVEDWVEQVIHNWEILCGPEWRDEDLGDGGQNAVSRNVLDILYRAATKTYHSHLVLKRLFHVHAALAEFDLALRALDSYIEIVTNAKARAEQSAQYGKLENDGTLLQTVSEGVSVICCFGSFDEAEKSKDYIELLKKYTDKHVQDIQDGQEDDKSLVTQNRSSESEAVSPSTIATAYRAVGIGLANWASRTPVNDTRDDIRAEAIEYLERSLDPELEDSLNFSSLYTLALLLAENRDLEGAIKCAKLALASNSYNSTAQSILSRERDLVPMWHLLSLLLSAKQDFEIAERSCEAAFEQFPNAVALYGHSDRRPPRPVQNGKDPFSSADLQHVVEQLRGREKERIIEARMTQIAFVELSEGSEAAVNRSDQLLGLFATLFPNLGLDDEEETRTKTDNLAPPKSSAGTVKSFRSSIFSRHRTPRAPDRKPEANSENVPTTQADSGAPRDQANNPDLPAIEVPQENGISAEDGQRQKLQKRGGSVKKPGGSREEGSQAINGDAEISTLPAAASPDMVGVAVSDAASAGPTNQAQIAKQPLQPVAHNTKHSRPPAPVGHLKQPPEQDVRLPVSYRFDSPTNAVTRFPTPQIQKHALCILVKIWLLIAGLYRRASLFDDAHEACEEASKHALRVEALVAAQECSARAFRVRGWGSGKSCDELWADLCSERGYLSKAQSRPHEAMEHFEEALLRYNDHPKATIGLANLLLDIWDRTLPLQPPQEEVDASISKQSLLSESLNNQNKALAKARSRSTDTQDDSSKSQDPSDEEPRFLNRLAARDRAYGLLSVLTKRGSSWDNSEAWYSLARAYEAGDQIHKLREVLWWCIELEDRRPIRHWSNLGSGLYVL